MSSSRTTTLPVTPLVRQLGDLEADQSVETVSTWNGRAASATVARVLVLRERPIPGAGFSTLRRPMASLDSLPADQRAVLQLVLQRGRSYDEIAKLLSIDRAAVRERALSAFDALGPRTEVPAERRALITDYLLGQLPARVSEQTRDRLAESPTERAWARVIASELAPLASEPLPEIPVDADAGRAGAGAGRRRRSGAERPGRPEPSPVARAAASDDAEEVGRGAPGFGGDEPPPERRTSRRGGALVLGLAAAVVVIAVVVILVPTGGGSSKKPSTAATHHAGRRARPQPARRARPVRPPRPTAD